MGFWLMIFKQCEFTALMRAAEYGHADCLRLLLGAGADMNARERIIAQEHYVRWCLLSLSDSTGASSCCVARESFVPLAHVKID